jgi:hypothetical protein
MLRGGQGLYPLAGNLKEAWHGYRVVVRMRAAGAGKAG